MASPETIQTVRALSAETYKYGFSTDVATDVMPAGLSVDVVRAISERKKEPQWMLDWRLKALQRFQAMSLPAWCPRIVPALVEIDLNGISYFAAPKSLADGPKSLDEVDPDLLRTFEKLGVPMHERAILAGVQGAGPSADPEREGANRPVAVDAVFDSVSVATTYKKSLARQGIIFCSISEAIREHPEIVQRYLGTVVPFYDNYFAALNSAVFSDGAFVFVPKGVACPMELSTYFRINSPNTGQFERTLIIVEEGGSVSYLEGCTAPARDENQLHAAVVELVALDEASIKYSTVQNWYAGDAKGRGGIYNFVTKRGAARGARSRISWTQVETGSAITWKYPSCVLMGDESQGEFYSVAITNNHQVADTGTKMVHIGANTRSRIVAKGVSAGHADQTYRGLVRVARTAAGARNFTQCDSLLIGDQCGAHTIPYIENRHQRAILEHEATTSKVSDDQIFYLQARGLDPEQAVAMVVNGFCREVLQHLPMEFAAEAQQLVAISLEGSVG